jgi:hypothetical protein
VTALPAPQGRDLPAFDGLRRQPREQDFQLVSGGNGVRQRLRRRRLHVLEPAEHDVRQDRLLVREVAVQRRPGDARRVRDVLDADAGEATGAEQLRRHRGQLSLAVAGARAAFDVGHGESTIAAHGTRASH